MSLPLGYRYAATYAGIRKQQQDDVALIVPDRVAQAAAVFTRNIVQAAPVRLSRRHLQSSGGKVAAILVNAGNANCATRTGDSVAMASCRTVAKALRTKVRYVLPASTGVIGVELNPKLLVEAVPKLAAELSREGFEAVARAILTTDTRVKMASEQVHFRKGTVRIAGMAKGSGMIHPNMATTLAFVMTDAELPAPALRQMLMRATERSFNALTVDGDTSTNDTLALLASGASKVKPDAKERKVFEEVLTWVLENLAEQMAADGEGARKLIRIRAAGFKATEDARRVARTIANSPLVKTAIAGSDPNWGRILAAAGYSGVAFDPSRIDIYLQRVLVCRSGVAAEFDEQELKRKLDEPEVHIRIVQEGKGQAEARFFTCDLTEGYIRINGSYRT
ncbi:MAG: bifunctional glutamate N-acetyltransferase/amino-acid acetyltransferase ArgJ [Acidobacteriaceae bacterium]|nr:bifunctional glutamate N-acetyltransferase/amino-acid acetyltransferase ArgJ [Acidobacteriaceae bacterium]MBV8571199.1 bifunctional glutamate N-acetyltransferase/amino-acid acetyltransferase ArgJ [Acidobacteriaceae bacterium]